MPEAFEKIRKNMIDGQIAPNKVTHAALIDALKHVPREQFVPRHLQKIAYVDEDIPLGNGRYLPEPMVIARMIQAALPVKTDIALDIGCGTGYSSALLGRLTGSVVGIERDQGLAQEADKLLHSLDILNAAVVRQESLKDGYAQQAPFNIILINGSVPRVPEKILSQLADGGRLVTVISKKGHMGSAVLIIRSGDTFSTRVLFDAATPTLAGFEAAETFVF